MKKIFLIFSLVFISFIGEAQVKKPIDTTQMCIPYDVAQKMLLDLNDYDRLKEVSKLDKKEITELNNKIIFLDKVNKTWEEKDSLSLVIISETEEKVNIYKEENKNLSIENKKLKAKNTFFNILSGAIIVPLTYVILLK